MYKSVTLNDVCEKIVVGHVGSTSKYYTKSGIPFLRTKNVTENGFDSTELKYITQSFHESIKKSQLKGGDILLSRVVTDQMRIALVPSNFGEANCANVIIIRPGKHLDRNYFLYLVKSPKSQEYLMGKRKGAAQQVVNTTELKNWQIQLPPVAEQKSIVTRLDAAFLEFEKIKKCIEQKKHNYMSLKAAILSKELNSS